MRRRREGLVPKVTETTPIVALTRALLSGGGGLLLFFFMVDRC